MNATIRKTEFTDYIDFRTDRVRTGRAFEIVFENGLEMYLPASWTKARVSEYVSSQMGGVHIEWVV